MDTVIAVVVIAAIVAAAVTYVIRAKRKGQKCIGCPYGKTCSGHCGDSHNENESAGRS